MACWSATGDKEGKTKGGKKSDLSTDVPTPSTLTPQIQITSSPNTSTALLPSPKQGTAVALGYPGWEPGPASPVWGGAVSITASERTNSPPCSLSSSGHRHLYTLSAARQLRSCRVLQGTPALEQSCPFQPMRKMSTSWDSTGKLPGKDLSSISIYFCLEVIF